MSRIFVADKNGRTDSAYHDLIRHIPSPIDIVVVSWVEGFEFNEGLLGVKDYCLICFAEYGWDYKVVDSHIWGKTKAPERYSGGDWDKFDDWVRQNPPKIMFKRELLKKDVSENVVPIDYPCKVDVPPILTEEYFNQKPIEVFQYWGRSSEHRIRIHADLWQYSYRKGFQICDNIYFINRYLANESGRKWITLWMPHYERIDIKPLMEVNGMSKLSLSWGGAGFKCFRTAEAPSNSVMVMHKNDYAFAYDWNESNCILVEMGNEIEGIEAALQNPNLYQIYYNGVINCRKYSVQNYIKNYILPKIQSV